MKATRLTASLAAGTFLALTPSLLAQFSSAGILETTSAFEAPGASLAVATPSAVEGRAMIGVLLTSDGGAPTVQSLVEASPAEKAGIKAGDIIKSVGDKKISDLDGLQEVLKGLKIGQKIVIGIDRDGWAKTVKLVLADSDSLDLEKEAHENDDVEELLEELAEYEELETLEEIGELLELVELAEVAEVHDSVVRVRLAEVETDRAIEPQRIQFGVESTEGGSSHGLHAILTDVTVESECSEVEIAECEVEVECELEEASSATECVIELQDLAGIEGQVRVHLQAANLDQAHIEEILGHVKIATKQADKRLIGFTSPQAVRVKAGQPSVGEFYFDSSKETCEKCGCESKGKVKADAPKDVTFSWSSDAPHKTDAPRQVHFGRAGSGIQVFGGKADETVTWDGPGSGKHKVIIKRVESDGAGDSDIQFWNAPHAGGAGGAGELHEIILESHGKVSHDAPKHESHGAGGAWMSDDGHKKVELRVNRAQPIGVDATGSGSFVFRSPEGDVREVRIGTGVGAGGHFELLEAPKGHGAHDADHGHEVHEVHEVHEAHAGASSQGGHENAMRAAHHELQMLREEMRALREELREMRNQIRRKRR